MLLLWKLKLRKLGRFEQVVEELEERVLEERVLEERALQERVSEEQVSRE